PSSYSNVTFTALGVRAIQLYSHPTQETEVAKHVAPARTWFLRRQCGGAAGSRIAECGFDRGLNHPSNPQSAIRNPQSAIRNPQSAVRSPQSEMTGRVADWSFEVRITAARHTS